MDWDRDLAGWPLSAQSQRIVSRPHDWHVQELGAGPTVLLLHGAGGSTHSFRDLMPLLATDHRVIALDLPGQGFSRAGTRQRLGLAPMSADIAGLAVDQGWEPVALVGHSAGGALALRLSQSLRAPDGGVPRVIGINAALEPFEGMAGWMFPILAKLLVLNPFVPGIFSLSSGNPARVRQLIEGTGSRLSDEGLGLYTKLIGDRGHVDATLRMMAQWDLAPLLDDLPRIDAAVTLIAGDLDRAVPPAVADRAAARLRDADAIHLDGLGHLAHEEDAGRIAALIRAALGQG